MPGNFTYWEGVREVHAVIKDQHKFALRPRLAITFETDAFSADGAESKKYQIDIIETIDHDPAIIGCAAIAPVIRRWQAFVRLYHNLGRGRYEYRLEEGVKKKEK